MKKKFWIIYILITIGKIFTVHIYNFQKSTFSIVLKLHLAVGNFFHIDDFKWLENGRYIEVISGYSGSIWTSIYTSILMLWWITTMCVIIYFLYKFTIYLTKKVKGRRRAEIIIVLVILTILMIANIQSRIEIKELNEQTASQLGVLIKSSERFNRIIRDYIDTNSYNESELLAWSYRSTSASIESYNLGLDFISYNYRIMSELLEKLSKDYKEGKKSDKDNIIREINYLIETNDGIFKIIQERCDVFYNIELEELRSSELNNKIDKYYAEQQTKFYGNNNE